MSGNALQARLLDLRFFFVFLDVVDLDDLFLGHLLDLGELIPAREKIICDLGIVLRRDLLRFGFLFRFDWEGLIPRVKQVAADRFLRLIELILRSIKGIKGLLVLKITRLFVIDLGRKDFSERPIDLRLLTALPLVVSELSIVIDRPSSAVIVLLGFREQISSKEGHIMLDLVWKLILRKVAKQWTGGLEKGSFLIGITF